MNTPSRRIAVAALTAVIAACTGNAAAAQPPVTTHTAGQQALLDAYPQWVTGIRDNRVMFTDGTSIAFDDGRTKDFVQRLDDSDVEDMFFVRYTEPHGRPEYLADAGRSRSDALFKKMYGASPAEVRRRLETVGWFGQTIRFSGVNGAADSLRAVANELAMHPELRRYAKCSGTFYWRKVRGANRLSAHSYGIAIDIAVDKSDYWLWKYGAGELKKIGYTNRIPHKIVEIFRRHGFIWGGAWYHFDTMHFEFRPEILRYAELTK